MKGNVLALSPKTPVTTTKSAKQQKGSSILEKAIAKDRKNSSIDFYKVATGDYTENQRLKMRQYQETLKSN